VAGLASFTPVHSVADWSARTVLIRIKASVTNAQEVGSPKSKTLFTEIPAKSKYSRYEACIEVYSVFILIRKHLIV